MGISLLWTLSGILLSIGMHKHYHPFRLLAFGLWDLTLLKAFSFDLDFLEIPYRVLAFSFLGLSLITTAWLYNRHRGV